MQTRTRRRLLGASGFAVTVFGLLCLNYTKMGNVERHTAVAAEHGFPPPTSEIAYLGMLLAPLGAGMFGYSIGARTSGQA